MNKGVVVKVDGIRKVFDIPSEQRGSIKSYFMNPFKKARKKKFRALKNVNFEVRRGDFFGVVGRNGSGKSTLLKLIAGVYAADKGKISIEGKIIPFLELGVGFNPELSGRDNIFLNGTILGMSKKYLEQKFDEIVEFSELEDFLDLPMKNYSSGMQVRLAFAIAIQADGDIYLLDEVLAVGDSNFQQKCLSKIGSLRRANKTIVFVTHDLGVVEKYCNRAVLLREGKVSCVGRPERVLRTYTRQNLYDEEIASNKKVDPKGPEDDLSEKKAKILKVEFLNKKGKNQRVFSPRDDLSVRVHFKILDKSLKDINFGVAIWSNDEISMLGVNTILDKVNVKRYLSKGFFQVNYEDLPLRANLYHVKCGIFGKSDKIVYDFLDRSQRFSVFSKDQKQGLVSINYKWE